MDVLQIVHLGTLYRFDSTSSGLFGSDDALNTLILHSLEFSTCSRDYHVIIEHLYVAIIFWWILIATNFNFDKSPETFEISLETEFCLEFNSSLLDSANCCYWFVLLESWLSSFYLPLYHFLFFLPASLYCCIGLHTFHFFFF